MSFPRPEFMRMALGFARRGVGRTSPNPAVGAVLVRKGKVVGAGHHRAAGMPHAEIVALRDAGAAARGADLYVTLEPCVHTGRTGPCTGAIIAAGVKRVAAAMQDPNPLVSGKGFRVLRRAGIPVVRGLMEEEARSLNRPYCRWIVTGRPFVTLKLAVSVDGQIASASGDSRWISGEAARKMVHRMRSEADAVLIGGETFRRDAPLLTSRIRGGRNPKRVILTSGIAGVARNGRFLEAGGEVIVVAPRSVPRKEVERFRSARIRVLLLSARKGRIEAGAFLDSLGREGITSLLVEGGGKTAGWLVEAGAVDRYVFFLSPLLLGEGVRSIAGFAARRVKEGRRLMITRIARTGGDLMVVAEPSPAV
jgi:diaminohydroxyphosphoribosylaminopyrimidine deaminase/5-amino-6-(5-phosphoribosylamino)uracil reductase